MDSNNPGSVPAPLPKATRNSRHKVGIMFSRQLPSSRGAGDCTIHGIEAHRAFFREWFAEDVSAEELYQFRVHVAWRLLRTFAVLRGLLVEPQDTLASISSENWKEPFAFGEKVGHDEEINVALMRTPVSMMPPEEGSEALEVYVDILSRIADSLDINATLNGRHGLRGLLDHSTIHQAMPTLRHILEWERDLVNETISEMREGADIDAEHWLAEEFELTHDEVLMVKRMALQHTVEMCHLEDPKAVRAMIFLKLDGVLKQMRAGGDTGNGQVRVLDRMLKILVHNDRGADEDVEDSVRTITASARVTREGFEE